MIRNKQQYFTYYLQINVIESGLAPVKTPRGANTNTTETISSIPQENEMTFQWYIPMLRTCDTDNSAQ